MAPVGMLVTELRGDIKKPSGAWQERLRMESANPLFYLSVKKPLQRHRNKAESWWAVATSQ